MGCRAAGTIAFREIEDCIHVEHRQDARIESIVSLDEARPRRMNMRRARNFCALLAGDDVADFVDDQREVLTVVFDTDRQRAAGAVR